MKNLPLAQPESQVAVQFKIVPKTNLKTAAVSRNSHPGWIGTTRIVPSLY